ncbi:DinB family protein [Flavobacterium soyangense]|uniref:DinB family protein n=1 Tax=Flavobacterium soyangense TaxID=2023265 RepID=A0A930UC43_9FLAO|nr:DinB family protein [Flavobacterium soyangense]MBF2708669.1 DinB family protein [Flavobacterium soyangense]
MTDRNSNFRIIEKPKKEEYPEYSEMYMELLKDDGMILQNMRENFVKIKKFIYNLPEEKLYYRYDEGKWTIKEILVHIIDDERIFAYRALRYGRNDNTPLHGFEENDYAKYSYANERSLDSIFEEYESVRDATLSLFQNLPEDAFMRSGGGIDNDGSIINSRTVRALAYHLAGHELRHIKIIKERYLNVSTKESII